MAAALAAAMVACAGPPPQQVKGPNGALTAVDVATASPLARDAGHVDLEQVDMLAVSPEMRAFIDKSVDRDARQSERLAQLLLAVVGGDRFALAYDDTTGTAAETFRDRRGNCLAFTSMFIAMARDLGMEASYQEVEIPPDWMVSGESFLINQHVNALVEVRSALSRVVDFNSYDTIVDVENDSVPISDARARAHYFNNIGVERLLAGDVALAYANLRQSVAEDPTFSSPWVNLGNLHRREGYPDYAEVAYREALEHDRDNLVAMSNLAALYRQQDRTDAAEYYLSRVRMHRMGNPFYRYRLAENAYDGGDYKAAIKNLRTAIRQKDDEDRFYFLLSLSYLMTGEQEKAERSMEEAREVAADNESRQRYNRKLDLLSGNPS